MPCYLKTLEKSEDLIINKKIHGEVREFQSIVKNSETKKFEKMLCLEVIFMSTLKPRDATSPLISRFPLFWFCCEPQIV